MNTFESAPVRAVLMRSVAVPMTAAALMAGQPVAGADAPPTTEAAPNGPTEAAAAYTGLVEWLDEHRGVVYDGEGSLAVGSCPLVDGDQFEDAMSASPLADGFESAGASITTHLMSELFDEYVLDDGDVIEPVGVRCDFAPVGNDARVDFVDLFAVDVDRDEIADLLLAGAEAGADLDIWSTRRAPGDLPGTIFSGCFARRDPKRCFEAWAHGDLVIVMYVGVESTDDLALVGPGFDAVLPEVVHTLAAAGPPPASLTAPVSSPAYDGLVSWLAAFDGRVYTGDDSLDIGSCPLVDAVTFNAAMATAARGASFEASGAAVTTHFLSETWYDDALEEGEAIRPVGMRCDFAPVIGDATGVAFADVIAVDASRDRFVRMLIDWVDDGLYADSIDTRTPPAGLPGVVYGGCLGFPDACIEAWVAGDLVVALYVGPDPDDESLDLDGAFDSMLPGIVPSLASLQP